MPETLDSIASDVAAREERLITLRRAFHQRPEPSFEERETAAEIARVLREAGWEAREGSAVRA